jgi:hypothetical protein
MAANEEGTAVVSGEFGRDRRLEVFETTAGGVRPQSLTQTKFNDQLVPR